ncbi:MAG: TonB-dependent receptor [Pedosphaera sp.]|nr:TonB-dependent receptor [Pedosphaera sp.]MST00226.1 TonB-dependent receptor [Pedosphaera sp.]
MKFVTTIFARSLRIAIAACALLGAASLGFAQNTQTNKPVTLPEVVVKGAAEAFTVPSPATAREQSRQTPGGVSVIEAKEYERGRVSNLKDMLDYAPGVFIQPRWGAEDSRLSIRGSGIQRAFHGKGLKLMQDGIPVNLAEGSFDFQSIEPLATSYTEVFRGANALRYGGTTLGGAINMVSRTGYDAAPFQARAEYGSFGHTRAQASSGGVVGKYDYYASLSHYSADGYRDHTQVAAHRAYANLGWRFRDDAETRLHFTHAISDSELPGALTLSEFLTDPKQAKSVSQNQRRDVVLSRLASRTVIGDDRSRLELSAWWSHKDLDHPLSSTYIDQRSDDFGAELRWRGEGELFGHRNAFTLGFNPVYGANDTAEFANSSGAKGAQSRDAVQSAWNLDLYAENQFYITPQLALVAGAQASRAVRKLEDRLPGTQSNEQSFFEIIPKAGLRYDHTDKVQFYGNVSRSFEPPTFGELYQSGIAKYLDAQTGTTVELGTRGESGRFTWDLSWYHSWLRNELLTVDPTLATASTVNAGETTHQGVELSGSVRLVDGVFATDANPRNGDHLALRLNYLWSHFRFGDDPNYADKPLPGLPEHYLRAELLYEHACGFYAGPNIEAVPDAYSADFADTLHTRSYAVLGFKTGYRGKCWSAFIEARNLTDEKYIATTTLTRTGGAGSAVFYPGDGRAVYGGIEARW